MSNCNKCIAKPAWPFMRMETWISGIFDHENGRCSLTAQTNYAYIKTDYDIIRIKRALCVAQT
jgi:hypothetical protein